MDFVNNNDNRDLLSAPSQACMHMFKHIHLHTHAHTHKHTHTAYKFAFIRKIYSYSIASKLTGKSKYPPIETANDCNSEQTNGSLLLCVLNWHLFFISPCFQESNQRMRESKNVSCLCAVA